MIAKIMDFLKDPVFYAALAGLLIALRGVGEGFKKIGDAIPGDDWAESLSAKISKLCTWIGKIMSWFGIGNAK